MPDDGGARIRVSVATTFFAKHVTCYESFTFDHWRYADPILDWSAEVEDVAVRSELRSVLTSALEELPDHYRAVIILHESRAWR